MVGVKLKIFAPLLYEITQFCLLVFVIAANIWSFFIILLEKQ